MELNAAKKEIVNHLIAAHEGKPWGSGLSKYFRAFSGAFSPDMAFTFYFITETRPVMYVYDPRPADKRSSRPAFHEECARKKPKILEISGFFEELADNGYLHIEYKGLRGRPPLPDRYDRVWRKYGDFYNDLMLGLSYVCLSDFTPAQKLYDLWKTAVCRDSLVKNPMII
jgi:hypothetical protein